MTDERRGDETSSDVASDWPAALAARGFVFADGDAMRASLAATGSLADWPAFAASWDDLEVDGYMADQGRYRRRRHAVFAIARDGAVRREPHQPHWQSLEYNPLHGDVARWFAPVTDAVASGASLATVLAWCARTFGALSPDVASWRVEVHQFRIEATPDRAGQPTPEGVHRDGVDWVLVLMVARHNIASGTTTVHDSQRVLLGSFTLSRAFDAALVDDTRIFHGVTPVTPLDPVRPAHRDVLVVTFARTR